VPLYSYLCESCGSEKDHIYRYNNRPDTVECADCDGTSKYVIRMSKAQSNDAGDYTEYKTDGPTLSMHQYKCNACSTVFESLIDTRESQHHDDDQECTSCGVKDSRWIPSVRIDRWSEMFPYYDRGLGVMLESKAHRREICKQRGLTPVDGDWDIDREYRKMDDINEKEDLEYADYCDKFDNSPEFREVRKLRDQGRL